MEVIQNISIYAESHYSILKNKQVSCKEGVRDRKEEKASSVH